MSYSKNRREQVEDDLNFNCGVELSEGLDMIVNTQSISYNGSVVDSYLNVRYFYYNIDVVHVVDTFYSFLSFKY